MRKSLFLAFEKLCKKSINHWSKVHKNKADGVVKAIIILLE